MAANHKEEKILTQTSRNSRPSSRDQKRKFNRIPQMSPEAVRAMGMVRDEVKENVNSSPYSPGSNGAIWGNNVNIIHSGASLDGNNNENKSQAKTSAFDANGKQKQESASSRRVQRLPPRHMKPPVSRGSLSNNPDRSRSTLSHTDPPFSLSDNAESCNQTSSASVYTTNNSTSQNGNNNNDCYHAGKVIMNPTEDDDYDDDGEENDDIGTLSMDQDFTNGNALPVKEKSFVFALDKALERNAISRLKGDITDTTRITKPGTVRALDGGRLANAQEVVVNVCHNDERQLVFHDDDEESLDTAKEISQIRVNIWMEYNSAFRPDNDVHEMQIPGNPEQSVTDRRPPSGTLTRTSREKTSAGSRKSQGSSEEKTAGSKDRYNINKNPVKTYVSKDAPASVTRPKSAMLNLKSGKSESSGSSRTPSQKSGSVVTKRTPTNSRSRR